MAFLIAKGFDCNILPRCQYCGTYGFEGTLTAIRRVVRLSEEECVDSRDGKAKTLLWQIRIVVYGDSATP